MRQIVNKNRARKSLNDVFPVRKMTFTRPKLKKSTDRRKEKFGPYLERNSNSTSVRLPLLKEKKNRQSVLSPTVLQG